MPTIPDGDDDVTSLYSCCEPCGCDCVAQIIDDAGTRPDCSCTCED